MSSNQVLIEYIENAIGLTEKSHAFSMAVEAKKEIIEIILSISDHFKELKILFSDIEMPTHYHNLFHDDIQNILSFYNFTYSIPDARILLEAQRSHYRNQLESLEDTLRQKLILIQFNLNFFRKIGFFSNNIVAVGANGSGKTMLTKLFRTYMQNNGIVVSAQRILFIPIFEALSNPDKTAQVLKQNQITDKSNKDIGQLNYLQQEFGILLQNIISENNQIGNSYRQRSLKQMREGNESEKPPVTKLDLVIEIWNTIIEHRKLTFDDGLNFEVIPQTGEKYPLIQMSDGEKVILFLIAQILQAPPKGFIVIDEPEMYLHKTILKKLWDLLEKEREDCIFIYLTHDLEFATSRIAATKVWIKSFVYPSLWDIEVIPENDLPDALLYELLGSRKNILFCEGKKGGIDEKIYGTLFPNFTVVPVESCTEVINFTKAFNKISNITTKAFGLIDSDHQEPNRLSLLLNENIYALTVAEIENLFLDEEFLKHLASQFLKEVGVVDEIKNRVITQFEKDLELQIANYLSEKINYYFKESHIERGNTLELVKVNYEKFTNEIRIHKWYADKKEELQFILANKSYSKVISIYNNKGLKAIVSQCLGISDFTERALKLLRARTDIQVLLKKYFPKEFLSLSK